MDTSCDVEMVSQDDSELEPLSEISPNNAWAANNQPASNWASQVKDSRLTN